MNTLRRGRFKIWLPSILSIFILICLFQNCDSKFHTALESSNAPDTLLHETPPPSTGLDVEEPPAPPIISFKQIPFNDPNFNFIPSAEILDADINGNDIFVATKNGLGISRDAGKTFKTLRKENGLVSNDIKSVKYLGGNLYFFARSKNSTYYQLFFTKDFGKTITPIKLNATSGDNVRSDSTICWTQKNIIISDTRTSKIIAYNTDGELKASFITVEKLGIPKNSDVRRVLCTDIGFGIVLSPDPKNLNSIAFATTNDLGETFKTFNLGDFKDAPRGVLVSNYFYYNQKQYIGNGYGGLYVVNDAGLETVSGFQSAAIIKPINDKILVYDSTSLSILKTIADPQPKVYSVPRYGKVWTGTSGFFASFPSDQPPSGATSNVLNLVSSDLNQISRLPQAPLFPEGNVRSIARNKNALFIQAYNGLFRSYDNGQTFEKLSFNFSSPNFFPAQSFYGPGVQPIQIFNNKLYVYDSLRVAYSEDDGNTFQYINGIGRQLSGLQVNESGIYVLSYDGLFHSANHGASFVKLGAGRGLPETIYGGLFGLLVKDRTIIVIAETVYISEDGGATFRNLNLSSISSAFFVDEQLYITKWAKLDNCYTLKPGSSELSTCQLPTGISSDQKTILPQIQIAVSASGLVISSDNFRSFKSYEDDYGIFDILFEDKNFMIGTSNGLYVKDQ